MKFGALLFLIFISTPALSASVMPFSSPESSLYAIYSAIESSNESVYISSYTFSNQELAELLTSKANVIILVEKSPVGGLKNADALCYLLKSGAEVYLYDGNLKYLHSKYIIIDNKTYIISTENFGNSLNKNRGYGAIVLDDSPASLLRAFEKDIKNSEKLKCENYDIKLKPRKIEKIDIEKFENQKVKLLIGPNLTDDMISTIELAEKSIYIEQYYINKDFGNNINPLLEKLVEKARKGVEIKILLDPSQESNKDAMRFIMNTSHRENLNIKIKFIDLKKFNYSILHSKMMIIDEKIAVISSINWSQTSLENNRETGIIISGESVEYFLENFEKDWNDKKNEYALKIAIIFGIFLAVFSLNKFLKKKN